MWWWYSTDLVAYGAQGAQIQWFNSPTATTPLSANTSLVNGTYYVSQLLDGCESTRKSVQVIVVSTAAPLFNSIAVCDGSRIMDVSLIAPPGAVYQWFSTPSSSTPIDSSTVLISGTYYIGRLQHGCASLRAPVTVIVNEVPNAPTGQSIQQIALPGTITDIQMDQPHVI